MCTRVNQNPKIFRSLPTIIKESEHTKIDRIKYIHKLKNLGAIKNFRHDGTWDLSIHAFYVRGQVAAHPYKIIKRYNINADTSVDTTYADTISICTNFVEQVAFLTREYT